MSQNKNQKKVNYISKINIINNKQNKLNNIAKNKYSNSKIININRIFTKNINNPKKSSTTTTTSNHSYHKKFLSNIEDYNQLINLKIRNKSKKFPLNKINKNILQKKILTERKIYEGNNIKKRNGNHIVLINTRNTKKNDDYRFITEYFVKDNNEKRKDFSSPLTSKKSNNNVNNNNSLSIDFQQVLAEASNKLIIKTLKKKEMKKKLDNLMKNSYTPNTKRYIKYLKANNLYNLTQDKTFFNLKFKKKEFFNINKVESLELPDIFKIFSKTNTKTSMTNYGYSFDSKKESIFRNNIRNGQNKIVKIDHMMRTYNNILTEKPSSKKSTNFNLKKIFPRIGNNLTIDTILRETKKKDLSKIKYKKIILKNRNSDESNLDSKEKHYLTTQNSFKNIISPKNVKKINIKNKYEIKKSDLWNLNVNLDRNSKLKIAKIMRQKKLKIAKIMRQKRANNIFNFKRESELEKKIKIKNIFSLTKKGFYHPGNEKPNQDNYFIIKDINNELNNYFIGVCDGHGKYGEEVSSFISLNLSENLKKNILNSKIDINKSPIESISKIITKTFIETNSSLINNSNIDISSSGCTCSSILLTQNNLISINLGDSRCILGRFNPENNSWSCINLTRDHKPTEEDEKERIIKKGGNISKGKDEFGNSGGIMRIWKTDGNIGLALTRSFGDEIMSKVGVICEPEIKQFFLGKDDKFIIIGTDGLWEYISSEECVNMVKDFFLKNDIQGAGNLLLKEASKRWIVEQDVVDDITIILIFLE